MIQQMPRSEEQVLSGEFTIVLNKKRHTLQERSIKRTKEFIRHVVDADGSVFNKFAQVEAAEAGNLLQSMGLDQVGALLIEYSDQKIQPEDIEEATVSEVRTAFDTVLETAGFFDLMWGKTRRMQGKRA